MAVYIFKKPGFKKRQSAKLKDINSRNAILMDVHLQDDGKILLLHQQKDYTLLGTFLHILSRLNLETETWEVRADEFKSWFKRTFEVNNRFDILKRLEWLSNVGLIEFKHVPNDFLKDKQPPLEEVKTLVPVISNNNQPTQLTYPLPPKGGGTRFGDFWEIYPNKKNKAKARSIWEREKLDRLANQIIAAVERYTTSPDWLKDGGKYIPHPTTFLNGKRWEDEITVQTTLTQPKTHKQQIMEAKRIRNIFDATEYNVSDLLIKNDLLHFPDGKLFPFEEYKPIKEPQ